MLIEVPERVVYEDFFCFVFFSGHMNLRVEESPMTKCNTESKLGSAQIVLTKRLSIGKSFE